MAKGNIAGIVRPERQADPGKIGAHRIEHRGFGIDGDDSRGERPVDPALQRLCCLDAFIGVQVNRRHLGQWLARSLRRGGRGGVHGLGRIELGRRTRAARPGAESAQQAGEAVLLQEGRERIGGNRGEREILQRDRQGAIFLQLDQHARQPRHLCLLDQAFAQLARLHRRRGGQRAFQAAMFLDQLGRGLRSDAADAGDVVDRIAHQGEHVAHQLWRNPELLDHFGHVDALVLHRIEHVDAAARAARLALVAFPDELHQILVRGNDGDVPPAPGRLARVGGDEVVRLEIVFLDAGQAEGPRRVANQRKLGDEVLRRRRAVRLVLIVKGIAERSAALVQDHGQMRRAVRLVEVIGQLPQHGGIAIDRTDRDAAGIRERGQAMVGAEDIGRSIDQIEVLPRFHFGGLAGTWGNASTAAKTARRRRSRSYLGHNWILHSPSLTSCANFVIRD